MKGIPKAGHPTIRGFAFQWVEKNTHLNSSSKSFSTICTAVTEQKEQPGCSASITERSDAGLSTGK